MRLSQPDLEGPGREERGIGGGEGKQDPPQREGQRRPTVRAEELREGPQVILAHQMAVPG